MESSIEPTLEELYGDAWEHLDLILPDDFYEKLGISPNNEERPQQ